MFLSTADDSLKQRLVAAMQLHVKGKTQEARAVYEGLLKEWPDQPDILHALGTIHLQAQDWKTAVDYFRRAVAASPAKQRHLLPLARALAGQGESEQTIDTLIQLLKLDPNHADAVEMLYQLCLPGMNTINRLIAAHPDVIGLRAVAIRLSRTIDDRKERLGHLEALYRHGISGDAFYVEYGLMLSQNGYFDRCLEICQEGLKLYPDSERLHRVRAIVYGLLSEHAKALADWSWVVAQGPEDHQPRANIGMSKLLTSDYKDGFEEFSAMRDKAIAMYNLTLSLPEWRGEKLAGKRLLIWCNEGTGDIIMYAALLPWVLAQGAEVRMVVYAKLIPLFARAFPGVKFAPFTPTSLQDTLTSHAKDNDFQVALTQLMPLVLPHYVPAQHPPYLKADAERTRVLREKYLVLFPAKKLVGIAWYTVNKDDAAHRNIPLSRWQPLFELPHVQYISLQYGDNAKEIAATDKTFPGKVYADPEIEAFEGMDGSAAQIAAMDEVVSIDNTTVHLAGALGIKTTMLLSAPSEWRWGLERTDSCWYKSLTIERQKKLLDWKPVLERVARKLL